jgi:DNA-binding response OmpR family regulator
MPTSILVVEDEQEIRDLLVFTLLRDGYEVVEAEIAEVALEKIDNSLPDLVLVDWMLPGVDGIDDYITKPFSPRELLPRLKALLRRSGSPKTTLSKQAVSVLI